MWPLTWYSLFPHDVQISGTQIQLVITYVDLRETNDPVSQETLWHTLETLDIIEILTDNYVLP